MAEQWLTAEEVAAWLDEKRPRRGEKPRTANTARTWLLRHYEGKTRVRVTGRGRPNEYALSKLEAALDGMVGQGAPGKPRARRSADADGGAQ